ncbi:MAG: carboxypeptidase regulatory-like domain-containing protein [Bacteroidales bacterium]|nr:carboxypeptidase regulatory-like domain-containing protein [Bacteroidales bacterium]
MKHFYKITVMMMVCFFIGYSAFADVTVNGFCYLNGVSDHSGTKVLFNAVSASAVTDSVYTNTDGSYLISLPIGIYTVHFSHEGWQPYTIPGEHFFFENITLDDVVLTSGSVEEVSGPQSGIWTPAYLYEVIGDISVPNGDTLIIEPGVTIKFMDYYSFNISGTLIAIGTETDSIFFTSGQPSGNPGDWSEIKFEDSSNDNSIISYASIEYADNGILCTHSSPSIKNNNINNNITGIYCWSSSSVISNNIIRYNGSGNWYDAGITCFFSSPTISNNTINNNNYRGIYCEDSSPTISNNTINNINISNNSYGIYCHESNPNINYNTISNNDYCGIYLEYYSSPNISNNTISNNDNGIILSQNYCSPFIINNTLFNNNTGMEAQSEPSTLEYNLFWENETTATGSLPTAFGVIITVNTNGDPCDTYMNLFMDPLFVDPGNLNFHLTENSPCIDAGNPDPVYYDPDGTISDIGAFYFEQSQVSQQIFLSSGFSFVSSHIVPENPNMLVVVEEI